MPYTSKPKVPLALKRIENTTAWVEKTPPIENKMAPIEDFKKKSKARKLHVEYILSQIETLVPADLTPSEISQWKKRMEEGISNLEEANAKTIDKLMEEDEDVMDEIQTSNDHITTIRARYSKFVDAIGINRQALMQPVVSQPNLIKPPNLKLPTFSDNNEDKFAYKNFMDSFKSTLANTPHLSDANKLTYLKNSLTGAAQRRIKHLSIIDSNYVTAVSLLDKEYLNVPYLVNETIRKLNELQPHYSADLSDLKKYVEEVETILHELQNYDVDLLSDETSGCLLISQLVISKLSPSFRKELILKAGTEYPSVNHLFKYVNSIITILTLPQASTMKTGDREWKAKGAPAYQPKNRNEAVKVVPQTVMQTPQKGTVAKTRICKFCNSTGHPQATCPKYTNIEARRKRCRELQLCFLCLAVGHSEKDCPGKEGKLMYPCYTCGSKKHGSAMCPDYKPKPEIAGTMAITLHNRHLLPVMNIRFSRGTSEVTLPCLLDSGSQASCLNLMQACSLEFSTDTPQYRDVVTVTAVKKERGFLLSVNAYLPGKSGPVTVPIFLTQDFHVKDEQPQIHEARQNMRSDGYELHKAVPTYDRDGKINIWGLIGVDILQHFPQMEKVQCMNGAAWKLPGGLIPFGNIDNFLLEDQIIPESPYTAEVTTKGLNDNRLGKVTARTESRPPCQVKLQPPRIPEWIKPQKVRTEKPEVVKTVPKMESASDTTKGTLPKSSLKKCIIFNSKKIPWIPTTQISMGTKPGSAIQTTSAHLLEEGTPPSGSQSINHEARKKLAGVNVKAEINEHPTETFFGVKDPTLPAFSVPSVPLSANPAGLRGTSRYIGTGRKRDMRPIGPKPNEYYLETPAEGSICHSINFIMAPKSLHYSPLSQLWPDSNVEQGIENLCSLESIGIREEEDIAKTDQVMIQKFQEGVVVKDNRYFVELPWHDEVIKEVPANYEIAAAVALRVEESLKKKGLADKYREVFEQQLQAGIIERVYPVPNPSIHKGAIWIPHRPVLKSDSITTKIRPVFNCSLKVKGKPSLNEAAYAGVDLLSNMVHLLLKFRENSYTLLADIKQAFLQIYLKNEDDKNRFSFMVVERGKLMHYRYRTIVFGFVSSPFILNYIIKQHCKKYTDDEASRALNQCLYVDNLVISHDDPTTLKKIYRKVDKRAREGGFEFREWNSNSIEVKKVFIPPSTASTSTTTKVLGYQYNTETDTICASSVDLDPLANTKREVLSQLSSVFDPLGIYNPLIIRGKLLMKEIWRSGVSWDKQINADHQILWRKLSEDLLLTANLPVKRQAVQAGTAQKVIVCCDASKDAYGFAVYAVGDKTSSLVFSKVKVSPLKSRSLPTLELLSVFLAFKCLSSVLDPLRGCGFSNMTVLVDSQVALTWLLEGKAKTKNVFVNNRLKEITLLKEEVQTTYGLKTAFRYVPSSDNLADWITRGLSATEFEDRFQMWTRGMPWMQLDCEQWPSGNLGCIPERHLPSTHSTISCVTGVGSGLHSSSPIIDLERVTTYSRLIGITSKVFIAKAKMQKKQCNPSHEARKYWVHHAQETFQKEKAYLQAPSNEKPQIPLLVKNLNLIIDKEGLLRSRGRISKTLHFSEEVKCPLLLPRCHRLTTMIIEDAHRHCMHLGVPSTINYIRQQGLWIPQARTVVRRVLRTCGVCRRMNAVAYKYPNVTDLPKTRVNFNRPFEHTGLDYTGHLWVKTPEGDTKKYYILVFTCMHVRAIHLEIVPDMGIITFLQAFIRFVNIYGIPRLVYSDNAKTFLKGGDLLTKALVSSEFTEYLEQSQIRHLTIPVYSAWVGSTWERMIRTVKACLHKSIGKKKILYWDLLTQLSDIQRAINSRPLTYRTADNELEIITPQYFLNCQNLPALLVASNDDNPIWDQEVSREELLEKLETRQENLLQFKQMWYEDYLLSLREQGKVLSRQGVKPSIQKDDVVLVQLPDKPRPYWLLGKIVEPIEGADDQVRSARVKLPNGAYAVHPISHLYPLELSVNNPRPRLQDGREERNPGEFANTGVRVESEPISPVIPTSTVGVSEGGEESIPIRPQRESAKIQRRRLEQWVKQGEV